MSVQTDICIIGGCGHVGFPLGLSFANAGKKVSLLDIDKAQIEKIKHGIIPFKEEGARELLKRVLKRDLLVCTDDPAVVSGAESVIVVTGTPLDEYLNPRLDAVTGVLDQYFDYFREGQTLILRSTLYPKTSENIHDYFLRKNKKIHVAFCPERVTEGHAIEEISSLPQIVSGFTPEGIAKAKELFLLLTQKVIELTPLEAELTKLFANAYRYIHFSISNQFYMITAAHKVNFDRIYQAMVEDYPRMKNFPTPGFTAGPCLLKDTMQLSAFANHNFYLGHSAMLVNENMPRCIVDIMKSRIDLKDKRVGILGMAFKAESDDKRDSLSFKLKRLLKQEAKQVYCSDEYIEDKTFISKEELIERSDVIAIGAPHKAYAALKLEGKAVFDIWGIV